MNKKNCGAGIEALDRTWIINLLSTLLVDTQGFTYFSISCIDDTAGTVHNLHAIGIASPQLESSWTLNGLSGTSLEKCLSDEKVVVVQGVVSDDERSLYAAALTGETVRVFVPLIEGGARYGILEAGYCDKKRDRPKSDELNFIRIVALQTLRALRFFESMRTFRQEHLLLKILLDTIPDAIYFKDIHSRFIRASRALAEKNGLDNPDALIGKTDFDLFTDEHARQAFEDEQRIMNTGTPEIDIIEKETWAGQRIAWVSTTKMPLYDDGAITGTFGISRDITHRREMEEALKRSEEKLQHANSVLEQRVAERTDDLRTANGLLKNHIGQLRYLNDAVYKLSQVITVDELSPVILSEFMERIPRSEGAVCLQSEDAVVCASASDSLLGDTVESQLKEIVSCLSASAITEPVIINDRTTDDRIRHVVLNGIGHLKTLIVIPLMADTVCRAQVQIFTTDQNAAIFYLEQSLLTTLAAHAAICLSNAINNQERAEKARLDGELDAARSIQRRFTPHARPDIPGIDLRGAYFPAHKVGGDYLDYFQTERGDWIVVIADVCGKGIPAALLMTTMRSAFRIFSEKETSAKALLCAVNGFMVQNIDERSFVTALCLIIAADGRSMSYARAGHPMLVQFDRNGGTPQNISCGGVALGLMDDMDVFTEMMEEKTLPLVSGDTYLIYTDGLVEASDSQKEGYGFARLSALLTGDVGSGPETLIGKIVADVKKFTGGAPDHDDLTLLVFRVQPKQTT